MSAIANSVPHITTVSFEDAQPAKKSWSLWTKAANTVTLFRNPGALPEIFAQLNTNPYVEHFPTYMFDFYIVKDPSIYKEAFKSYRKGGEGGIFTCENNTISKLITKVFPEISTEDCLLTCSMENSAKLHSFLVRSFTTQKLQSSHAAIQKRVDETLAKWGEKETLNLSRDTRLFTSSVVGDLFLGFQGSYESLTHAIDKVMNSLNLANTIAEKFSSFNPWSYESQQKEDPLGEALQFIKQAVEGVMDTGPLSLQMKSELTADRQRRFTDDEIRATALVLFLAGQDTSANLLSYILLKLAQDPSLQEKVYREEITIDMLVQEGLRMFTPAPLIARYTSKDLRLKITLSDNQEFAWNLPKGALFAPAPAIMAKNPQVVGDDKLDTFNPSRWKQIKQPVHIRALGWLPFGSGKHLCPGANLAHTEVKLFLKSIIGQYVLSTTVEGEPKQEVRFINQLPRELPISLKPRQG